MPNIYRPFPGDITKVHGIRIGQAQNAEYEMLSYSRMVISWKGLM